MFTNVVSNNKRIEKHYLYICIILFLFEILFFILIKNEVFKSSDFLIQSSLQPNLSDNKVNEYTIPKFITFIYYSNKIFVPYIIIIIVNNYSNIYNIYTLFNILSICCYISCMLKFIFFKMIKNDDETTRIYYCGKGWNLPSTEMIISVVYSLSLWKFFFSYNYKKFIDKKTTKIIKYIILGILIIYYIINLIILAKIGYYLFSHLIFSAILGVLLYLFIFETNILRHYNSKEFCIFIKNKFERYMIIYIFLVLITFLPYILQRKKNSYDPPDPHPIKGASFYKNCTTFRRYVDDTFSLIAIYFAHIFVVLGIKCEHAFYFRNNILNFEQYHFGVNFDDLNLEEEPKNNSGLIVVTRETEWNNTSFFKSTIRLILSFALSGICFLPYFLAKKEDGVYFSYIFLVKYFCSYALFSFGITFVFKIIFRILHLSNEILGSILDDQ